MHSRISQSIWTLVALAFVSCTTPVQRGTVKRDDEPRATRKQEKEESIEIPKISGLKKRIWILDFSISSEIPESLIDYPFNEYLKEQMGQVFLNEPNSAFVPVTGDQATLEDLRIDSLTPIQDVAKVARGTGVSGFVRGDIYRIGIKEERDPKGLIKSREIVLELGIEFELVDASAGRSLAKGKARHAYKEMRSEIFGFGEGLAEPVRQIKNSFRQMSLKILKELNPQAAKVGWSGRLLKLEGARLYINAGRSSGLRLGDILKVVEPPRDVFDPQTGKFIGQAPGRVKGTAKVIEYFGLDGAVAMLQSGGGLLPGDRIEMF